MRETMQLGQTETKCTSPPASPGPDGVEWIQTLKPGKSAALEVAWLLAHVSAHFKRCGTDINRQLTTLRQEGECLVHCLNWFRVI